MITFWILWVFNAIIALVPLYFFFVGLRDGSVSSKNMGYWVIILFVVALVVGGSLWLNSVNHIALAKGLLILAAIPGFFAILYFLIVIIGKPRWN